MATDYQGQITALYDRLAAINSSLSLLVLESRINSLQETLQARLDTISNSLSSAEINVRNIQLDLSDVITDLISK